MCPYGVHIGVAILCPLYIPVVESKEFIPIYVGEALSYYHMGFYSAIKQLIRHVSRTFPLPIIKIRFHSYRHSKYPLPTCHFSSTLLLSSMSSPSPHIREVSGLGGLLVCPTWFVWHTYQAQPPTSEPRSAHLPMSNGQCIGLRKWVASTVWHSPARAQVRPMPEHRHSLAWHGPTCPQ